MVNTKQAMRRLLAIRIETTKLEVALSEQWPIVLEAILKNSKLSLRKLALEWGYSPTYLSHVRGGKIHPSPSLQVKMTEVYCR